MATLGPLQWTSLFLSLGLIFGALAGTSAYLILYREYVHHFKSAGKARLMAAKGALLAFLFFVGLSLTSGFVISHFIASSP
jgi:hypothetical protein